MLLNNKARPLKAEKVEVGSAEADLDAAVAEEAVGAVVVDEEDAMMQKSGWPVTKLGPSC